MKSLPGQIMQKIEQKLKQQMVYQSEGNLCLTQKQLKQNCKQ